MENPLISVIIPIYNSEDYLKECLISVKNQRYTNLEIILIDDGSTDGSQRICQEVISCDGRFCLYVQKNCGVGTARNNGLKYSHGEYFTFVDSDDVIDEHYIENLYNAIVITKTEIAVCDFSAFLNGNIPQVDKSALIRLRKVDETLFEHHIIARVCGGMFSRKIVKGLKFDTTLYVGEDLLFFCSMLKKVNKIAVVSGKFYFYRLHGESACHGQYSANKYTEILAWVKVRELFADEKRIFRKINSIFGCILLWHVIGIKKSTPSNVELLATIKFWMKKVVWDFLFIDNTLVNFKRRLLFIGLLLKDDTISLIYEKAVSILHNKKTQF